MVLWRYIAMGCLNCDRLNRDGQETREQENEKESYSKQWKEWWTERKSSRQQTLFYSYGIRTSLSWTTIHLYMYYGYKYDYVIQCVWECAHKELSCIWRDCTLFNFILYFISYFLPKLWCPLIDRVKYLYHTKTGPINLYETLYVCLW